MPVQVGSIRWFWHSGEGRTVIGWLVALVLVGPPALVIAPALMAVLLVPTENAFRADRSIASVRRVTREPAL